MFLDSVHNYYQDISPLPSLPNIHPVTLNCIVRSQTQEKGSLYVSNLEGAQNPQIIKSSYFLRIELKVSSVLTCAEGYRLDHGQELVSNYKYLPVPENPHQRLQQYFKSTTEFLTKALSKSNCLIHCLTGEHKSIAVVAAYLIKVYRMTLEDALDYVRRKTKLVNLNEQFIDGLKMFVKLVQAESPKTNQSNNHTLTYKSQNSELNSKFNKTQPKNQFDSKFSSQFHTANNSLNLDLNKDLFKQTAVTFNQKTKLETHASQMTSNYNHSRYETKSPEIHSIPNSKEISLQSHLQNHIEKSKTQASKVPTQKKSRYASFSVNHQDAQHFDKIFSSAHEDFIGVKRDYKNSSMSSQKEQRNTINLTSYEKNSHQFLDPKKSMELNEKSKQLNKSRVSQSGQKSQNKSKILENESRMYTKQSQVEGSNKNYSHLKILNPQNDQVSYYRLNDNKSSMRMKSKQSGSSLKGSRIEFEGNQMKTESDLELSKMLSPAYELGESRREYYSAVNEELNENVKEICGSFESEISNCRIKYQNRLRQLKEPVKGKPMMDKRNPVSPIV